MKKSSEYIVTLTDTGADDGEYTVGHYGTLEEAKAFIQNFRYLSEYRRGGQHLDISPDGMSGSGNDGDSQFTYTIKEKSHGTPA